MTMRLTLLLTLSDSSDNRTVNNNLHSKYKNTQNGITLSVDDYLLETKSETYGVLEKVSFTLFNEQGSDALWPDLLLIIEDKDNPEKTVTKKIPLSEYLSTGEGIRRTVVVDLGIASPSNTKEFQLKVLEWGRVKTLVRFETDLEEGYS